MKSPWVAVCLVAAFAFLWMAETKSDEPAKAPTPAADPMRGKAPGDVRDDNALKIKLVWCPPGFFTMEGWETVAEEPAAKKDDDVKDGAVDPKAKLARKSRPKMERVPVKVFLTKGYWLGKNEVTQAEWKQALKTEPWKGKDGTKEGADFPAAWINWDDAADFCRKFTEQERQAGRLSNDWEYKLPTEAQWERACRARTDTRFSFGDDESKLGDYAWTDENTNKAGEPYAHRVGQKKTNPWGICDMYGNVAEWCRDDHVNKLPGGRDPEVKLEARTPASSRVFRGGCFDWDAGNCGSSKRNCTLPSERFSFLGFRVALSATRPTK